jgi:peroxiredoxin
MPTTIGSPAPDFSLPDTSGKRVSPSDLKGRKTLIVFIPFPFTGNCEKELCTLRDHLAELNSVDANVVAITCDTQFSNDKWSQINGFGFPVLSDFWPHGATAMAYGVFNQEKGCAVRTTFVLDQAGVIREIVASGDMGVIRSYQAYQEALAKI